MMETHAAPLAPRFPLRHFAWIALGFLLLALVVFRELLLPGQLLLTTDDNIGALALRKAALPYSFFGGWNDSVLVGHPFTLNLAWTNILLWLMPLRLFSNWMHALDLVLAALFLVLFLRARGLGPLACSLGGVVAMWLASNFTLTYAGHINKFGILLFAAAALWLMEETAQRRRPAWGILAGFALGAMFLEQPDVALFFAMVIFPYGLFALWRETGLNHRAFLKLLAPCAMVAALVGIRPLWEGYRENIRDVAGMDDDPRGQWEFITQWSWPPEESLDFFLMGYTGWRSGEPDGPYRGRMGRSAGWEDTGQGFRNFKLENQYLGAVPLLLFLWAGAAGWALRRTDRVYRLDVLFWLSATLLTLVLSFGKFTPLYRLFTLLPLVSSIRNPNKFLQVFQLALAVGAALGLDALVGRRAAACGGAMSPRLKKGILILFAAVAGILLISTLAAVGGLSKTIAALTADGWGDSADSMARLRLRALLWGTGMTTAAVIGAWLALRATARERQRALRITGAALLALVVVDVVVLSRHYVKTVDDALIRDNGVVQHLKAEGAQRVILPMQSGYYNAWLTYLFPYHNIDAFNITQMPRMPADYQRLLAEQQRNPFKIWRLCGVDFLVGPGQVWAQIQSMPQEREHYELTYAYRARPNGPASVEVIPGNTEQLGDQVVIKGTRPAPRYALVGGWAVRDDDQALAEMTGPGEPFTTVSVSPDTAGDLPPSSGSGLLAAPPATSYRPGKATVKVQSSQAGILRFADKYTPDWKALLDGQPVPVLRCDFMFPGVYVPPGLHEVELVFAPGYGAVWLQFAGTLAAAGALLWLVVKRDAGPALALSSESQSVS